IDEQGTPFLVMEYIAGKTLERHLDPSTLTPQRACAWAADLANALALSHRAGILHGDVKPGNILVTPENKVKLGDFGIARYASQISGSGRLLGTPAYLAPEQIQGQPQDARSDQFALGIVLYQMLTGARPFDGSSIAAVCAQILQAAPEPPSRHNPAVPAALVRIVARCLSKNPADRFASCDELASALYPLARASSQAATAKIKKRPWWSRDRNSTRLNSSHRTISYAVFCLKKKIVPFFSATSNHQTYTHTSIASHLSYPVPYHVVFAISISPGTPSKTRTADHIANHFLPQH